MLKKINKVIPILFIILIFIISSANAKEDLLKSSTIEGKKLAMVIAYRNFEDTEFGTPKKMLEDAGAFITVVSTEIGMARSMYGHEAKTDVLIGKLVVSNFDAIVFIGGVGVRSEYWENSKAHAIAREAVKQNKILAAICWAPVILANANVLKGKKATCNTLVGAHKILIRKGADYTGKKVEKDGNIITGSGPGAAEAFAKAIIEALK